VRHYSGEKQPGAL